MKAENVESIYAKARRHHLKFANWQPSADLPRNRVWPKAQAVLFENINATIVYTYKLDVRGYPRFQPLEASRVPELAGLSDVTPAEAYTAWVNVLDDSETKADEGFGTLEEQLASAGSQEPHAL